MCSALRSQVLARWNVMSMSALAQVVERRLELGDRRALGALERIEVGPARAEEAVGRDQALHVHLLARDREVGTRLAFRAKALALARCAKDSTTGAWAMSRMSLPSTAGTCCRLSK
jgi:hypothetical protein